MPDRSVDVEADDSVLVITINRPESLNAIDRSTSAQIHAALDVLEGDERIRVGILTGVGRAFCAGSDIKEIRDRPAFADGLDKGNVTSITGRSIRKPLIAAVNGLAYGGGAELVLSCDLAVASAEAMFGLPEVKHGLVAAAGGLVRGPRQLPLKVVMDMALTAEPISAQQALTWGLVSRVADDALAAALEMAHRIASLPGPAVMASKSVIYHGLDAFLSGDNSAWDRVEPEVMGVLMNRRPNPQ